MSRPNGLMSNGHATISHRPTLTKIKLQLHDDNINLRLQYCACAHNGYAYTTKQAGRWRQSMLEATGWAS